MATESCPRCGEKAINETGHCVFCGAVVIAPKTLPAIQEYNKALQTYRTVSVCFLIFGIVYLTFAGVGSVILKAPMLGLFIAGAVTTCHGVLLIMNNDWMRSVTKLVCIVRLCLFGFMFAILIPYFFHMGPVGIGFAAVFVFDIVCLILMTRCIDDVYFA